MNRFIVTTSIHGMTPALCKFAAMPGWKLIVVGDMKTPHGEYAGYPGVDYLSPGRQVEEVDKKLSDLIGWNCIQRRNVGFVYAMRQGADLVATVDDDNIPDEEWGRDVPGRMTAMVCHTHAPAFDPLFKTIHPQLWHRGFPLQWVEERAQKYIGCELVEYKCDVYAGAWDGAPDVDAVCRLIHPYNVTFPAGQYPVASTKSMPFNSQNTILTRAAMKSYFCFAGIGRHDDILAAFVTQAHGHRVVFGEPTVFQKRNPHNIVDDLEAELWGYRNMADVIIALQAHRESWRRFVPTQTADGWDRYRELVA